MQMTETIRAFIREHINDDALQLVLGASRYKGVDVRFAAKQISARKRIKGKLPSWYADGRLVFPSVLSAEQCSSEQTAAYKQRLVGGDVTLCDMTGGLGVDSCFFAQKARRVTYVERNADCCAAARQNFKTLGVDNVDIINADAESALSSLDAEIFYFDPSRRSAGDKRVFAMSDCEPNLTKLWPLLREKRCKGAIAKLSPMLDIKQAVTALSDVVEVHVVSVRNDCKELLVVSSFGGAGGEPAVRCVNFTADGGEQDFSFFFSEERSAGAVIAKTVGKYLYEPNASILKAGAYKTVAQRFGLEKLDVSSHLYTSDDFVGGFAGRKFDVVETLPFDNRLCRELPAKVARANIAVRNFPLSADELRKRLRIADGGETYLFATTLRGKKVIVRSKKI